MAINSISFTNTPQARDDAYTWTEDQVVFTGTNITTLDVMANDLGGNAKKLYSIDDGNSNPLAVDTQLLVSDITNGVSEWETTDRGNLIRINNGKIEFNISHSLELIGATNIDALSASDAIQDSFVYAIRLGNGTLSQAIVRINVTGTNDAPVVTGSVTGTATEDGAIVSLNALAYVSDVDHGATLSVTDLPSSLPAGVSYDATTHSFSLNPTDQAYQHLAEGQPATVTLNYGISDGTVTVPASASWTIVGTNDAAVLGSAIVTLAETDAPLSTGGTLTISDVDSPATFQAQDGTAGAYGTFSIGTDGAWTYTASSAHNEFAAGTTYTDTFTVKSADGTTTSVAINIDGTNDAAVLSSAIATLTETDAPLSTGGTLTISDVDSPATFQAQDGIAGAYGTFSIGTDGVWTYTANSAFNNLNVGNSISDTFVVKSADSTETSVTVTIEGSNDAAVISSAVAALTETNTPLTTGGTLTISDVDSAPAFQVQTGTVGSYGTFSIDTNGVWTYAMSSAHNEFGAGTTYTDTFTVKSADGTESSVNVNITGTNDAPVLAAAPVVATTTFEEVRFNGGWGFTSTANLTGNVWHTDNSGSSVEIGSGNVYGIGTSSQVIELERNAGDPANLYTNITAAAGNVYSVAFDYSPRAGVSDSDIGVFWGGTQIGQLSGITVGLQHFNYTMSAPTAGAYRLEFRANNSNGVGGLLDNIVVQKINAVTEQVVPSGNLATSGSVAFTDMDLSDVHLISATPSGSTLGSISVVKDSDTTGTGTGGQLTWTYSVADSAVEYLAAGQTKVESFNITVDDQHGGVVTRQIDVTIFGTNDAPVAEADKAIVLPTTAGATSLHIQAPTDVDGDALSINVTGVPTNGVIKDALNNTITSGTTLTTAQLTGLTFTPSTGAAGTNSAFAYTVSDTHGGTDSAAITTSVLNGGITTTELITNGDFETGTLSGWQTTSSGSGSFYIDTSSPTPRSNHTEVTSAASGTYFAVSDQTGPTVSAIEQSFTVPTAGASVTLSFDMFVNNWYSSTVPGGTLDINSGSRQYARVDLLSAGSPALDLTQVIHNFYSGADNVNGTPVSGWHHYSFDISQYVSQGGTFDLRFAQVDTLLWLNQGVDSVSVKVNASAASASQINGTDGSDVLVGGSAADTITGGSGSDFLSGGAGSDTFVYQALSDGGATGDVITDFTKGLGGDVLNLHTLLTSIGGPSDNSAFTNGWLKFDTSSGVNTVVQIDSNGGADSFVTLVTLGTVLTQADTNNYLL
ncbi:MAG: VCBS domain-containing protein [Methylobacter sp.]